MRDDNGLPSLLKSAGSDVLDVPSAIARGREPTNLLRKVLDCSVTLIASQPSLLA